MVYHTILEAVGHTPLIRLNHMTGPEDAEVLVKFEGVNIGGSIKTRTALHMIACAEERGLSGRVPFWWNPPAGTRGSASPWLGL